MFVVRHFLPDALPLCDEVIEDNGVLGIPLAVIVVIDDACQPLNGLDVAAHLSTDRRSTFDALTIFAVQMVCHPETPLPRRRIAEGQLFAVGKRIKGQQLYLSPSSSEQTVMLQLADGDVLGTC